MVPQETRALPKTFAAFALCFLTACFSESYVKLCQTMSNYVKLVTVQKGQITTTSLPRHDVKDG
jgi:hypothetical protein